MFNVDKIKQKVYGVVGFRQPYNPALPTLDADNLVSRSGLIVNDNPYVKLDFLKATDDYIDISDADFNEALANKQKESIISVCSSVFNKGAFLEQSLLFRNANNKVELESLPNGFVGYEIDITNKNDVALFIPRILLEFDGTDDIEILLFNSSQKAPIQTKTVTITTDMQEVVLGWKLDNSDNYFKGKYYLGYISTGLTVTPFKRNYESSDVQSCYDNINVQQISVLGHATNTLFDLNDIVNTEIGNGLNVDFACYNDYTNIIIQNEQIFATAILYDLQISCLAQYLAAMTSNADQRRAEQLTVRIIQEIEGQQGGEGFVKITGLRSKLMRSLDDIKTELDKLRKDQLGDRFYLTTLT